MDSEVVLITKEGNRTVLVGGLLDHEPISTISVCVYICVGLPPRAALVYAV